MTPQTNLLFGSSYTRRQLLKATGATLAALSTNTSLFAAEPAPPKPNLHVYSDYSWLRGFGVIPSWAARIEDAWWFYDGSRMREEVALARQVHANCIRVWIEFTAWFRDPDKITAHFMDAVAAVAENGMKVMPCLFNRWHDTQYDYGGTYLENIRPGWQGPHDYVKALVTPLINDDRILMWDLCNEPTQTPQEVAWLSEIAATVRACGARQPITIGTPDGLPIIEAFAPIVDVLCAHPYVHNEPALIQTLAGYRQLSQKLGKPLMANETIPGALDDAARAEVARFYTERLSAAGFGWMGWALREGRAISTRRDRFDANGIHRQGFHPFFTQEGKLRPGTEFLTEKPKLRAPWEKQ